MIFINTGSINRSPGGSLGCLLGGIVSIVLLYFIARGLYYILYWAAPALFILSLIINWRAVADTGTSFLEMLRRNPIAAILWGAACVLLFPFFSLYLFVKSIGYKRLQAMQREFDPGGGQNDPFRQRREGDFVDFEELESKPKEVDKRLLDDE